MQSANPSHYHRFLIFLHWAIFILFVLMYLLIEVRYYLPETNSLRTSFILWHKSIGVALFMLVICRLVMRLSTTYPPIKPALNPAIQFLNKSGHIALYAVMFIMPISGYIMSTAGGRDVAFFGIELPRLVPVDAELGGNAFSIHVLVSKIIYVLVTFHVLFAWWHHYIRRDNTLIRIMPKK